MILKECEAVAPPTASNNRRNSKMALTGVVARLYAICMGCMYLACAFIVPLTHYSQWLVLNLIENGPQMGFSRTSLK